MARSTFSQCLCGRTAVLSKKLTLYRAAVHAYSYRDIAAAASVRHSLYPVLIPDISGIYPYLVDTCRRTFERYPVIKMYVCDNGYIDRIFKRIYKL